MTKGQIKSKLTKMYQLRKELKENLLNTKEALNEVNHIIDILTSQLESMEKEMKS